MSFHHAFIGGLLEHTLNAMEVADAIVQFYPGLNRDLVVAGIFLHDIAKTWELQLRLRVRLHRRRAARRAHRQDRRSGSSTRRRRPRQMLGEPIPQQLIDVLQHIILSHHGEPEFGAPQDARDARGDRGAHDREHGREADDVAGGDARRERPPAARATGRST